MGTGSLISSSAPLTLQRTAPTSGNTVIIPGSGLLVSRLVISSPELTGHAYDQSGFSVSSAGDINGDGFADIIVGVPGAGTNHPGGAAVLFGGQSFDVPNLVNLDEQHLPSSVGFWITGASGGDFTGFSVSAAGDLNRDGYDDLLVGSPGGANGSGAVDILYGRDFLGQNPIIGTSTDNILGGGSGNDRLMGLGGNDVCPVSRARTRSTVAPAMIG